MKSRFDYTKCRIGDSEHPRPYLDVVLSCEHGHVASPEFNALVDTGSDICMFDWALAHTMGFDPHRHGVPGQVTGLGGAEPEPTRIVPVTLRVSRLGIDFAVPAQFCQISARIGVTGLLGHLGFLAEIDIRFHQGKYFEITDDAPAPVTMLQPVRA